MSSNRVAVRAESQVRQITGIDLAIDTHRHRHLLIAPLHHVQRELDQLGACELRVQLLDELPCQGAGLGQLGIGQRERGALTGRQRPAAVVGVGDRGFVEAVIPGNCQAKRQSSTTVVVARAAQPDQLGGDRVDGAETHNGGLPGRQRLAQPWHGSRPVGDPG